MNGKFKQILKDTLKICEKVLAYFGAAVGVFFFKSDAAQNHSSNAKSLAIDSQDILIENLKKNDSICFLKISQKGCLNCPEQNIWG